LFWQATAFEGRGQFTQFLFDKFMFEQTFRNTEAQLANVAQLDTDEKVVFAQRIIIMQTDAAKLDSTFLKYLLLSQPVQQRIRAKGTVATVQGIKASLLK
jgi:hypothetical protein